MSRDTEAELVRRVREIKAQYDSVLRDCFEYAKCDPDKSIAKAIPQSQLFMIELIPIIHRLYLGLPEGATKTVLDVGPQNFAGTALLASVHGKLSFNRLKLTVSAIDIISRLVPVKECVAPDIEFIVGDIYALEARTWDTIIASHVIEHVPAPARFVRRLQELARDYVIIACPWEERPLTASHINTIDGETVRAMGARDLNVYVNYSWGKHRKVCTFWVEGRAKP